MNEEEKIAFTAGFVDADGHFHVVKETKKLYLKTGTTSHVVYYYPRIVVTQKDPAICYWLKEKFGGYVGLCKDKKKGTESYQWSLKGRDAVDLAKKLQPYLITKKEQVKKLFEIDNQYKQTCEYCGKQFVSNFRNQKFCNNICRVRSSKTI